MDLFCRELFWPDGPALFRQTRADLGISPTSGMCHAYIHGESFRLMIEIYGQCFFGMRS
jgi:hypothetical protein